MTQNLILERISALPVKSSSTVWVGYSGGIDSTVLLHGASKVFDPGQLNAIHVNHQLNQFASAWVEHCTEFAKQLGISLKVVTVQVAEGNVELQSRLRRYEQFQQCLEEDHVLLTAHHKNDVAETVLWQLLTGRAPIGIPTSRSLGMGKVLRPLLDVSRQEIGSYAEQEGLKWVDDNSNLDLNVDRNWIRQILLPTMEIRFPDASERLGQPLESHLQPSGKHPFEIDHLETSLTSVEIRAWLLSYNLNPPGRVIEEIISQSQAKEDANPEIQVSSHQFVRRYDGKLYVVKQSEGFKPTNILVGEKVTLDGGRLTWEKTEQGFQARQKLQCTNREHLPETERSIRTNGMTKKISNLFQENRVLPWLRQHWPILHDQSAVVCVPNLALDETKLDSKTSGFLPIWTPTRSS